MPELPEVETVRAGLARLLPGRQVAAVDFDWPGSEPGEYLRICKDVRPRIVQHFFRQGTSGSFPQNNAHTASPARLLEAEELTQVHSRSFPNTDADVRQFLIAAKIVDVKRRAKVLLIELDSKYSLVVHLKMTGQLVFDGQGEHFGAGHPNDSLIGRLPDKSTRVTISFADESRLFFNDQRKFGWMKLLPTAEVPNIDFMKRVGPEPLATDFTWQVLRDRLQRRKNTNIKAAILDQSVVAGIGNIYADESLWTAKIHPATLVKNVSPAKIKALHQAIVDVLNLSIANGGSSDRNYVDAEGQRGSYLKFAKVFRREGQPCPRCGHEIIKIRVAGRGTHICPHCQKLT